MIIVYLLGGSVAVLILIVMVIALVSKVRSVRRRKALEQLQEGDMSGLALVRYVQLNRQCSEEVVYQRLATFVKRHVPPDDASSIERMATHDRQSLLEIAQGLLIHDPDEIDKI